MRTERWPLADYVVFGWSVMIQHHHWSGLDKESRQ